MDANQALLIAKLLGIAGAIGILAVAAFLFFELRRNRDKAEVNDADVLNSPPAPLSALPTAVRVNPLSQFFQRPAPALPNAHEVLRVARDNLTGRLMVELAGKRFTRFVDIQEADLAQALVTTVRDLEKFTGGTPPVAASVPVVSPALAALPTPAPVAPDTRVPSALPTPPSAAAPAPASKTAPPLPLPSMNPFKQMKVLKEMEKRPVAPLQSIPEIIDEYLQHKLLGTPHIWRGIRVKPGPKDTVLFEVDGLAYDSVDGVPDETVRALLREAIAEWDAKK
jgi:hypothetical protein